MAWLNKSLVPFTFLSGTAWTTSKITDGLSVFPVIEPYFEGIALLFTGIGLLIKGVEVYIKWRAHRKKS